MALAHTPAILGLLHGQAATRGERATLLSLLVVARELDCMETMLAYSRAYRVSQEAISLSVAGCVDLASDYYEDVLSPDFKKIGRGKFKH